MVIINTKVAIYKHRQDGSTMRLIEILRTMYKEMKADEYDCKVNQKMNNFEKRLDRCGKILRTKFAYYITPSSFVLCGLFYMCSFTSC